MRLISRTAAELALPSWPRYQRPQPITEAKKCAERMAPWGVTADGQSISSLAMAQRAGIQLRPWTYPIHPTRIYHRAYDELTICYEPNLPSRYKKDYSFGCDPSTHWIEFVVAHEIAHTFYWNWDPTRLRLVIDKPALADGDIQVERFCDAFAYYLMILNSKFDHEALIWLLRAEGDRNQSWMRRKGLI